MAPNSLKVALKSACLFVLSIVIVNGADAFGANYSRPHEPDIRPAFIELPLGTVRPQGWLKDWCEAARDGYVGHYDEYGEPFAGHSWTDKLGQDNSSDWSYEQSAYWIDGMTRLGYVLQDQFLIDKATGYLSYVISHQNAQGYLGWGKGGNTENDWSTGGTWPHWCINVLSRALIAWYSATKDPSILTAMNKAYQNMTYTNFADRRAPNVEAMLEFYAWGGEAFLKDNALQQLKVIEPVMLQPFINSIDPILVDPTIIEPYRSSLISSHGVTYNEHAKLFAIAYPFSGNADHLSASIGAYRYLRNNHMQPYGLHSAEEYPLGVGALAGTETCNIADYLHSNSWLFRIIGQAAYGDYMEKAFFNAAPAAIARDFKSLQYFQHPNRVLGRTVSNGVCQFTSITSPACCSGNSCRILPTYVMHMWMATYDNGLAATLYGPCIVNAKAADNVNVQIDCSTTYPFEEEIRMTVTPERAAAFPLYFRVPSWCEAPSVRVNGESMSVAANADGFVKVDRTWQAGDLVAIGLPMKIRVNTGRTKSNGATAFPDGGSSQPIPVGLPYATVERGPLLYALGLPEIDNNTMSGSAIYNYALDFDSASTFTFHSGAMPGRWDWPLNAPVSITAKGVRFAWGTNSEGNLELPASLVSSEGKTSEDITLVPYGDTKFRVSMFPVTSRAEASFTQIAISPSLASVKPGERLQFHATAVDLSGQPISSQPSIGWSVSGGGNIDATSGEFVASGTEGGPHRVVATTTISGSLVSDTGYLWIRNENPTYDQFDDGQIGPEWQSINTTDDLLNAAIEENNGRLLISGKGADVWQTANNFVGVWRSMPDGDFDVSVQILSQTNSDPWAKAGILAANDVTQLSKGGYCAVAVTPANGFVFQYDADGVAGELESTSQAGSTMYPCWLRLSRTGSQFSAYYAANDKNWKQIGTSVIPQSGASASKICLFSTAHSTRKMCGVEFANYNVPATAHKGGRNITGSRVPNITFTIGSVRIVFPAQGKMPCTVRLTDLKGRTVATYRMAAIEDAVVKMPTLASGMYFINLQNPGVSLTRKFIITR